MGTEFQCCKMKREMEKDDCDGCTLCVYLTPFNCTVKMINMVSFMCIYHNRKIKQQQQQQRMNTQKGAGEDRARRNSSVLQKKEIGWEHIFGYNIITVIFRTGMKCVLYFMVKSETAK